MSETIKLEFHNNDTTLPRGKRSVLAFPHPALVPCVAEESADGFSLSFDIDGLVCLTDMASLALQDKYRVLYNCASLHALIDEFSIGLSPDNVYLDVNLTPKLLRREIGKTSEEEFLAQYKALIGCVLYPKYNFEDYYSGGADLYKKRALREVCQKESWEMTRDELMAQYQQERDRVQSTMTSVKKGTLTGYRAMAPVLLAITAVCVAAAVYLFFFALPFSQKIIEGNNAYLRSDYMSVQEKLQSIQTDKLPTESKYVLARSYVITEGLNSAQKENVLAMLTPITAPVYFDFWIELGRLNFDEAIDVAQRIGDNQLLLLAYIKYEAFLETDTYSLSGDVKAEKITGLREKIEKLSASLESEREALTQETPVPETEEISAATPEPVPEENTDAQEADTVDEESETEETEGTEDGAQG